MKARNIYRRNDAPPGSGVHQALHDKSNLSNRTKVRIGVTVEAQTNHVREGVLRNVIKDSHR